MATESTSSTSLAELRRPPAVIEPTITIGFDSSAGFALMQRGAQLLASSTLVPQSYQGNVANCTIALNMAVRLNADPMLVMQNLNIIHNRPSWSSQFLIATWNKCGRFTTIRYRWTGAEGKDDWGCRAWSTELATQEEVRGPVVTIKLAKNEGWYQKNGSKWQTMPELMLMYRAAAFMIRTHAPELSMGLKTDDELDDMGPPPSDTRTRVTEADLRKVIEQRPVKEIPHQTVVTPAGNDTAAPAANGTVTQEQAPAAKKFIDEATAKKWMKDATSADHLEKLWATIMTQLDPDKEIPAPIEAYYHFRKEALAKALQ